MLEKALIISLALGLPGVTALAQEAPLSAPPVAPVVDPLDGVSLAGVVVTPDGTRSSAVLRAAGRARVVGVGDLFLGARVATIKAGRVTLEAAGRTRELRFGATPERPALPVAPAVAGVGTNNDRVFTRTEVERRIADETPRLLSETALIPVTDEGRVSGFTLSRVPEGSLLTDLGLRAGDVLTDINGTPIDSMATLLALYARLRNESEIRATVLRGGSAVPLVVRLR